MSTPSRTLLRLVPAGFQAPSQRGLHVKNSGLNTNLHKNTLIAHLTQHRALSDAPHHFGHVIPDNSGKYANLSSPNPDKSPTFMTAEEAVKIVKSGDNIFVQGVAATPTLLLNALCHHAKNNELRNIKLHHLHLEGDATWVREPYCDSIRSNCMFIGHNMRRAVAEGKADCMSIFLHEIPQLFRKNKINLDVAFVHVSKPDLRGFCSLGTSVDTTPAAINNAKHIVAIVNPNMPRTFGDGLLHTSNLDTLVYDDSPLWERPQAPANDVDTKIGQIIADELVADGATLQMGIGAIPDAALNALGGHKDLGIHTEMFSDGVLNLVNKGVVHPGKIVSGFVYGSAELYAFMHDNPMIYLLCKSTRRILGGSSSRMFTHPFE